jgi:hypothetical protein
VKRILFSFLFILSWLNYTSAQVDSLFVNDSTSVFQVIERPISSPFELRVKENTLSNLYSYYNTIGKASLGNIGSAEFPIIYRSESDFGFTSFLLPVDKEIPPYFTLKRPYTSLSYTIGAKQEQLLDVVHTQNILPNWNMAVVFRKIRSEGFYLRQETLNSDINVTSNYRSKTNKYQLFVNGGYYKLSNDENGGIKDDSLFDNNVFTNKALIDVNLVTASSYIRQWNFSMNQYYALTKDSVLPDSVFKWNYRLNRLHHHVDFHLGKWRYDDTAPDTNFYSTIYLDSTITQDSSEIFSLNNSIFWQGMNARFNYFLGYENQISSYKHFSLDTFIVNHGIKLGVFETDSSGFDYNIFGNYVLAGYNESDLSAQIDLIYHSSFFFDKVALKANYSKVKPAIDLMNYASNHFQWDNSFEQEQEITGSLTLQSSKQDFGVRFEFTSLDQFIYFDETATPQQSSEAVSVFAAHLNKNFTWKKWHFNNQITYQTISGADVLRLPQIYSKNSVFIESYLFKKKMRSQIGVNLTYYSSYYSPAFMPALGQYHLQNERKTGNYPFIDVFFSAKIMDVRVFIIAGHVNAGLFGNKYYGALHYPTPDLAVKFGMNWQFHN